MLAAGRERLRYLGRVDILELVRLNLLSPMVLAFVLGVLVTLAKSDLKFPPELYTALSIYLLFAIGLKGGVELARTELVSVWQPLAVTLLLGTLTPLWSFWAARHLGRFSVADAAALAAHYGSVSAVTFIATQSFLQNVGMSFEGYTPALLALMEVPAIVIALLLARVGGRASGTQSWPSSLHEILTGKSVVLLAGGLVIGYLVGPAGFEQVIPFFVDPFRGVLTLFLLELGMLSARRLGDLRRVGPFLVAYGVVLPLINGLLGVAAGTATGMSAGGATLLGVLSASASYIAAPAAVRIALPEANPSFYLTASLAITFPFNLTVGIPLFFSVSRLLNGGA